MTKIPPFDPADLKSIRLLHQEGKFPKGMNLRTALRLCRLRRLASVKIQNEWHTTETAIRAYIWDHANLTFRQITS